MSLAHQYAIYLMEHDWKPLKDHSPNVSLKTWLINGFRFVVLDALKWYKREYGSGYSGEVSSAAECCQEVFLACTFFSLYEVRSDD